MGNLETPTRLPEKIRKFRYLKILNLLEQRLVEITKGLGQREMKSKKMLMKFRSWIRMFWEKGIMLVVKKVRSTTIMIYR